MTTKTALGRHYAGKSDEDRKIERRALLLEAAILVYGEMGYPKATVRQICTRAGLTARYFYESFSDGEDLFAACYDHVVEVFLSKALETARAFPDDKEQQVLAFHRTYFSELREQPDLARVFLMDVASVSTRMRQRFEQSVDMISGLFPDHVPIAHTNEQVREYVRRALAAGTLQIARRWVEENYQTPIEHLLAAIVTLYSLSDQSDAKR